MEGGKSCENLNAWGEEGPKIEEKHKEIEGKWEKRGRGTQGREGLSYEER